RLSKRLPGAVELSLDLSLGAIALAPQAEAGLLAGFADRGDRKRFRARGLDLRAALQQVRFELPWDRRRHRDAVVGLIDPAAGKDEFAGHEHHLVMPLADQTLRNRAAAVD